MEKIREVIQQSVEVKQQLLSDEKLVRCIREVVHVMVGSLRTGGRVMFCGNGGSAADAQHLAAELSGRFYFDRPPLPAEALHVNTSYLTAVANDYGYDEVFARMVRGQGRKGDVLVGLSTSGNSPNVVKAFQAAREMGITVVAFTGAGGGEMAPLADLLLNVPSADTPRIQEAHILIGHIVCQLVESELFAAKEPVK